MDESTYDDPYDSDGNILIDDQQVFNTDFDPDYDFTVLPQELPIIDGTAGDADGTDDSLIMTSPLTLAASVLLLVAPTADDEDIGTTISTTTTQSSNKRRLTSFVWNYCDIDPVTCKVTCKLKMPGNQGSCGWFLNDFKSSAGTTNISRHLEGVHKVNFIILLKFLVLGKSQHLIEFTIKCFYINVHLMSSKLNYL